MRDYIYADDVRMQGQIYQPGPSVADVLEELRQQIRDLSNRVEELERKLHPDNQ